MKIVAGKLQEVILRKLLELEFQATIAIVLKDEAVVKRANFFELTFILVELTCTEQQCEINLSKLITQAWSETLPWLRDIDNYHQDMFDPKCPGNKVYPNRI